jgi:hypothetical protein
MRVDPSLILILYTPPRVSITFRVTNEGGYPIANATISANLSSPAPSRQIMFQVLTGRDGTASLELPILDPYDTTYNVKISHPEYISEILILRIKYLGERPLVSIIYRGITSEAGVIQIIMRRGLGELIPISPLPNVTLASIVDLRGAPGEIRIGKPIPIFITPIAMRFVRPDISDVPWSYIGIIVGCCIEGSPVALFLYYDQSLNLLQAGGMDYRWYILPEPFNKVWIGYDDNGLGVTVILSSGKAYYFLYDRVRGYHTAFWGVDIPVKSIYTAFYRNNALIAVGDGVLHIQRLSPLTSMPCTRGGDYLGIPLGLGVGISISPDGISYIVTTNSVYVIWGLVSIIANRCPLNMVRVWASIPVKDLVSSYILPISEGYVDIYEDGSLVARSRIYNGSSVLYLPSGMYDAMVMWSVSSYSSRISVSNSTLDLRGPALYRVNISTYYYNPESLYTVSLQRAPPGLKLVIDDRIEGVLRDGPISMLLPGGMHSASLIWGDAVLARGFFNVSNPGSIDLVLIADLAILNISISVLGSPGLAPPLKDVRIRLFGMGPLLNSDLGSIRPGEVIKLPLGIYRIVVESPFFYTYETIFSLREAGSIVNIPIFLRPREISVKLVVVDDFGSPIANATISISRIGSDLQVFTGSTSSDGTALIPKVSFGDYLVSVKPANESVYTAYQSVLRIDRQEITLSLNRTRHPISIAIVDPLSGRPIAPLGVTIYVEDRPVYSVNVDTNMTFNVSIPFGNARIVIKPSQQAQRIYSNVENNVSIDVGGGRLEVMLVRRIYEITLKIVNDIGQPVQGAMIVVRSAENQSIRFTGISDAGGVIRLRLPYSIYMLEITAQGYNRLEGTLTLDKDSLTFQLRPTLLNLIQRYVVIYIVVGIVVTMALILRYLRRYIERKIREEAI